ncbi:hypothetical protein DPMN_027630 [Dreissena polymorpha]|uniref:Secreted protein n=1 Tax=Dreissena polymorpha TaxID=45954 RepID=A0A9D4LTV3_DREPO|nr:hypothetical protein DPMN_027630 [Dreissena polymorpha]
MCIDLSFIFSLLQILHLIPLGSVFSSSSSSRYTSSSSANSSSSSPSLQAAATLTSSPSLTLPESPRNETCYCEQTNEPRSDKTGLTACV